MFFLNLIINKKGLLKYLRFLLFPLAFLYGTVAHIRNLLFNLGFFSSKNFRTPSIGVGNLSMGGTGKSVVVTYLIEILQKTKTLAILSRGYARKTRGLRVAGKKDTAATLGDEPFQFFQRFPSINVVVSEKRALGMEAIDTLNPIPEVVIMDDVMQHRWVKPSILIVTTDYKNPYFKDYVFPMGGLREFRSGINRADIILVTHTPNNFSKYRKENFLKSIKSNSPVLFTKINYDNTLFRNNQFKSTLNLKKDNFILVTGIADPTKMVIYLESKFGIFKHLRFPDHHSFSKKDVTKILKAATNKIILTTEKDYGKLYPLINDYRLCYIRIHLDFISDSDKKEFDKIILDII